jgi:putative ABC transport system permease protein
MSFLDGLRYRLRVLRRPGAYDRELDEEMRFHLALESMQQQHALREAATSQEVRRRARRRFGNPTYHKEETRRMSALAFFDTARQDVRFALRTLRRTPGFTAVAVLTLALGIGANTAIFGAVDAMLLRPLPYREPERLMLVTLTVPPEHGQPAHDDAPWSYLKARVFRGAQHVFSDLALSSSETVTLRLGDATREEAEVVDEHYLPTLGISPVLGRNFVPDENTPNGKRVVLVSERFWNSRLNADPSALGRTLDVERVPYTIIGVLPDGFTGISGKADLWMTIGARRPYYFEANEAWDHEFTMIGRLAPGITAGRARADIVVLGKRVNAAFPSADPGGTEWGATVRPLNGVRVDPLVRQSLLVLLGAVGFVLLIACANLANLFLVRASARQREIAVRLAIGASRRRLARQLLTESVLLSLLGGIASVALAWWGARTLATLSPERALGARRLGGLGVVSFASIHLDWRGFAFAAAAALVTGVLFGLVPAIQATRPSLTAALKEGTADRPTRRGMLRRLTIRDVLVMLELALALVLLAGAGVMVRSLGKLLGVNPGFDAAQVFTVRLNAAPDAAGADSLPAFYHQLLDRLRGLPGVQSAALADCPPLAGRCNSTVVWIGGRSPRITGAEPPIGIHRVTPDWFKTVRVPLIAGRTFTDADRQDAPKVLVLNQMAARRFWPNGSAIGQRVGIGMGGFDTVTVIGVVGDVRYGTVDSLPGSDAYLSYSQAPRPGVMAYLRTSHDPASLAVPARRAIHEVASDVPVYDARTLASRVADATAQARFIALLLALFAAAALVLASVGIYGVVSYAVSRRTREIGIRVALGASRADVLRLVVGRSVALASAGLAFGLVGAVLASRVLRTLLFAVAPTDPGTYLIVLVLMMAAAVLASWVPARRAASIHPSDALRD